MVAVKSSSSSSCPSRRPELVEGRARELLDEYRFEQGSAALTGVITFKPAILHWAMIGMSLLMVGIVLINAFFKNFGTF
jgi:hypothetical protein